MPGGGWEGVPKTARALSAITQQIRALEKMAADEERDAFTKGRCENELAGGDGVDVETGGNGVPGDSNGK